MQSTRGFGTQSCPSPLFSLLSPAATRVWDHAPLPRVLESVRQRASFQLCLLLLMLVSQPITSSQLHRRPLWRALGRATVEAREVSQ